MPNSEETGALRDSSSTPYNYLATRRVALPRPPVAIRKVGRMGTNVGATCGGVGGGGPFRDFTHRSGSMSDLKHENGATEVIEGLKSLIHGERMGCNLAKNSKIPGSLAVRDTKTLIYVRRRKSETDLRIG